MHKKVAVFGLYFDTDPISTPCRNRVRVEIESDFRTLFRHYQITSSCSVNAYVHVIRDYVC